jgi:hypothetical protein
MHVHANSASQGAHNIAIEFFGDHLDEFQRHLLGQSHAESTVVQYLRCIGTLAKISLRLPRDRARSSCAARVPGMTVFQGRLCDLAFVQESDKALRDEDRIGPAVPGPALVETNASNGMSSTSRQCRIRAKR